MKLGDRMKMYEKTDIFVYPGYTDTFGFSILEAMSFGIPIVTLDGFARKEIVEDGKTGFLVNNIKEAIESINKVYKIDRKYCREWVEKRFTRERMVDDYINVYKKILEAKEF